MNIFEKQIINEMKIEEYQIAIKELIEKNNQQKEVSIFNLIFINN